MTELEHHVGVVQDTVVDAADVAVAVLAAGGSRRLGRPKQLVELDGTPLVHHVAATCAEARPGAVAVVLGAGAGAIAIALREMPVTLLVNDAWAEGIASSIRVAVHWARATPAGALVIVLADQPLLTVAHVTALRDAWRAGAPIAGSRWGSIIGAPAIFDQTRWDHLASLEGDRGAAHLLRGTGVVAIDWPAGALDIDTDDDVRALEHHARARPATT